MTIAGGGLAGLSLAAGLRLHGVPATVHEAGSYPRHRVCGEFISGVEMRTLEALGIADLFSEALPRSSVAWFREGRCIHEDRLPSPAMGISRHRLDDLLMQRVRELGGQVIEKSRRSREPGEGFVWAAGRIPAKSRWIGLKVHCRDLEMVADLEMHLGTNGYAGLAGVESTPREGSEVPADRKGEAESTLASRTSGDACPYLDRRLSGHSRVNVCGLFRVDRALGGNGPGLLLNYLRAGGNMALADRIAAHAEADSFCAVAIE